MTRTSIYYADGTTTVMPRDLVEMRLWANLFRRQQGSVVYVPGISKLHSDMEFGGLCWVGVRIKDGTTVGTLVDPETRRLKKGVRFLQRGIAEELAPDTPLNG